MIVLSPISDCYGAGDVTIRLSLTIRIVGAARAVMSVVCAASEQIATGWAFQPLQRVLSPWQMRDTQQAQAAALERSLPTYSKPATGECGTEEMPGVERHSIQPRYVLDANWCGQSDKGEQRWAPR